MSGKYQWWQTGVIYQIYPRSFVDSNGDGIGDLPGITSRLDYLQWLSVSAIWISPCFKSPMKDFGYDVSDYCDIDPIFGALADMDHLVAEAHHRGIRVILDFVPNHTSDQHPWFIESRSSRDNPKRDWYMWVDAKPDGSPPNNWLANFGGIGWEWDELTGQYYYHGFLKEQPDLNWRNPDVQAAMFDNLRFWLDRGIDGFRVDVMNHLIKDAHLRDNPVNPDWKEGRNPYWRLLTTYSVDQPEVHDIVRAMRQVFDEYPARVIIGEIYLPIDRLMMYYGANNDGAHLPFNFQLLLHRWEARRIGAAIDKYEASLPEGAWPNWVLGNHDRPRVASRVGSPAQARVAAMLLLTLRGTPTVYYGDELGMENVAIPPEKVVDPPGVILGVGRDPERTPMQWDDSRNAGFTTASEAWLPVSPHYADQNIAAEREDAHSMLTLHRRLLQLRRSEEALMAGDYAPIPEYDDNILAYTRKVDGAGFLVLLNFGQSQHVLKLGPEHAGRIVLSTHLDREGDLVRETIGLRADEGLIVRLN